MITTWYLPPIKRRPKRKAYRWLGPQVILRVGPPHRKRRRIELEFGHVVEMTAEEHKNLSASARRFMYPAWLIKRLMQGPINGFSMRSDLWDKLLAVIEDEQVRTERGLHKRKAPGASPPRGGGAWHQPPARLHLPGAGRGLVEGVHEIE